MQGNGGTVTSVAELPEAMAAPTGARQDRAPADVAQLVRRPPDLDALDRPPGPGTAFPITAPRCIDRSKPSRLMVDHILR